MQYFSLRHRIENFDFLVLLEEIVIDFGSLRFTAKVPLSFEKLMTKPTALSFECLSLKFVFIWFFSIIFDFDSKSKQS